jgi:hypothetical protein
MLPAAATSLQSAPEAVDCATCCSSSSPPMPLVLLLLLLLAVPLSASACSTLSSSPSCCSSCQAVPRKQVRSSGRRGWPLVSLHPMQFEQPAQIVICMWRGQAAAALSAGCWPQVAQRVRSMSKGLPLSESCLSQTAQCALSLLRACTATVDIARQCSG